MENKLIIGDCRMVKLYEDRDADTFWQVQSLKTKETGFIIRVSHTGEIRISSFPRAMRFKDRTIMLKTFCRYISSQGISVIIKFPDTNISLKKLCLASGFKYLYHEPIGKNGIDVLFFSI